MIGKIYLEPNCANLVIKNKPMYVSIADLYVPLYVLIKK